MRPRRAAKSGARVLHPRHRRNRQRRRARDLAVVRPRGVVPHGRDLQIELAACVHAHERLAAAHLIESRTTWCDCCATGASVTGLQIAWLSRTLSVGTLVWRLCATPVLCPARSRRLCCAGPGSARHSARCWRQRLKKREGCGQAKDINVCVPNHHSVLTNTMTQ